MRHWIVTIVLLFSAVLTFVGTSSNAVYAQGDYADSAALKAAPALPPLILSAPPREPRAEGEQLYRPLAQYLSAVLGRRVEYRHPGNWGAYRAELLKDVYDLTFDEAHFNSYRSERLGHRVLVRLPGTYQYAVIISYDHTFTGIGRMTGRSFCTFAPPNLGTMVLLDLFNNPVRQPSIIPIHAWEDAYQGVLAGRCNGALLPLGLLRKLDPEGRRTKVLFNSAEMPNQALVAGPRVTGSERAIITGAMLAPQGAAATEKLRQRWGVTHGFVASDGTEYVGFSDYLRNERGFY